MPIPFPPFPASPTLVAAVTSYPGGHGLQALNFLLPSSLSIPATRPVEPSFRSIDLTVTVALLKSAAPWYLLDSPTPSLAWCPG